MQELLFHSMPMVPGKYLTTGASYVLSPEKITFISQQLDRFMPNQKPFLKAGYSIRHLADDISVPAYQLSAYLNRQKGMNFNDYLNSFRVRYCKELMQQGLVEQLNLHGLALSCGFHNRNTFTTAFKKFTGLTPSGYSKSGE